MAKRRMTPQAETLAYRIWGVAQGRGWDLTIADLAAALDVDKRRIGRVVAAKGWTTRLRSTTRAPSGLGRSDEISAFLSGGAA